MENAVTVIEAKWSDEVVVIGQINGEPLKMRRPLNEAAMKQLDVGMATALALHDRVLELEARLKRLEDRAVTSPESL